MADATSVKALPPSSSRKSQMIQFLLQEHFLKQVIVNHINNRMQDFADPITSTLILMATSPVQVVFCEEGFFIFKTTNLPLFPYSLLEIKDKQFLLNMVESTEDVQSIETYHGCGKFSVQISKGHYGFLPKKELLLAFVDIMLHQNEIKDQNILQRLGYIIVQRFLSSVSMHSDDISEVMEKIWGTDASF